MSCLHTFDRLCRKIVCPTRHHIDDEDMIDRKFRGRPPNFKTFSLKNPKGNNLSVILFNKHPTYPTVLYLHGNGGNKMEVLHLVKTAEEYPVNFCAFDFSGCGKSEGEFVLYGDQEVEDIHTVMAALKKKFEMKTFFLWGRSMGASLGLLYSSKYPGEVKAMVLDSPFKSLQKVVFNVASGSQTVIPGFVIGIAVFFVRWKVEDIVKEDIFNKDYSAGFELLGKERVPLIFAYSVRDNVVKEEDVMEMYQEYRGPKKVVEFNCLHPDDRPSKFVLESLDQLLLITPSTPQPIPAPPQPPTSNSPLKPRKISMLCNPRLKWNS